MKFKWTEENISKIITNSIVLAIAVIVFFAISNFGVFLNFIKNLFSILSPFITGFIIAYLLVRPVNSLEKLLNSFLFKKSKRQTSINRGISIFIVLVLALFLVALVIYSIIPQLIDSVSTLARNADSYIRTVNQFIDAFSARFNLNSDIFEGILGSSQELFKKITQYFSSALPQIFNFSISVGSGISNFIIGFILSIYMLSGKERFAALSKKLMFALLPEKTVNKIINLAKYTHATFGNYLTGRLLDSAIVGVICFIAMSIFGMEFALLISMTVAITNIIPFIGPFIGAIPSAFILLMVQPTKVIWFIIMIFILQQIDGNLLAPKIVGKTTGLSSFWIIFSILLGGGLFGIPGVLLAVPTFSVIHLILKKYIRKKLSIKNLPTATKDYF